MSRFHGRHRSASAVVVVLGAMLAVAFAGVASAGSGTEKAVVNGIVFEAGGSFSPKTLSKTKQTPIGLTVEGKISESDGSHPPALKEALIETDKNGMIDVKGYPTCSESKLQSTGTQQAERACPTAIIGTGQTTAGVEFEEQPEIIVHSKLLVFNGGESGGVTTLYIHAFFSAPVTGAIVTTVKIKKIHNGRYGTLSVASIPKIAGGSGSVRSFNLKIEKQFTYKGKKVSVLTAKCPDGKLQAHATAIFSDGTRAETEFIRPCTGR